VVVPVALMLAEELVLAGLFFNLVKLLPQPHASP
jgi:hypothetical protein